MFNKERMTVKWNQNAKVFIELKYNWEMN